MRIVAGMSERPASSVILADGSEIRPLTRADSAFLADLYRFRDNATLVGSLDIENEEFAAVIRTQPWAMPMTLVQDGELVGAALIAAADTQNRHGRLIVLTTDPKRCRRALTMYLRHAFWSHPYHRLYLVLPRQLALSIGYGELLRGCGFVDEGCLLGHLQFDSRTLDLDILGLLRSEFDAWCRENEDQWLL